MRVDFNVVDFLHRGALVHPERTGVCDEVMQPAESWGDLSYAELARRARAGLPSAPDRQILMGERGLRRSFEV